MNGRTNDLAQHLARWVTAYGADLTIPTGQVAPRVAAAPPPVPGPTADDEPSAAAATPAADSAAEPDAARGPAAVEIAASPGPNAGASAAPNARAEPDEEQAEADVRIAALQALRAEVLPCTRCKLHQGRLHTVFGEGDPFARVMFVGEAPGAREDECGRPFVGPAGQLLERILAGAMGLQRSEVFIANVNKCRPPGNRAPAPDEVAACLPYLRRQVELIRPEVIVCLGRTAAQNLLGSTESTRVLRSGVHDYAGIPVVVTWHPAYLLREPAHKRETWDDIKKVNRLLGLPEVPSGG